MESSKSMFWLLIEKSCIREKQRSSDLLTERFAKILMEDNQQVMHLKIIFLDDFYN